MQLTPEEKAHLKEIVLAGGLQHMDDVVRLRIVPDRVTDQKLWSEIEWRYRDSIIELCRRLADPKDLVTYADGAITLFLHPDRTKPRNDGEMRAELVARLSDFLTGQSEVPVSRAQIDEIRLKDLASFVAASHPSKPPKRGLLALEGAPEDRRATHLAVQDTEAEAVDFVDAEALPTHLAVSEERPETPDHGPGLVPDHAPPPLPNHGLVHAAERPTPHTPELDISALSVPEMKAPRIVCTHVAIYGRGRAPFVRAVGMAKAEAYFETDPLLLAIDCRCLNEATKLAMRGAGAPEGVLFTLNIHSLLRPSLNAGFFFEVRQIPKILCRRLEPALVRCSRGVPPARLVEIVGMLKSAFGQVWIFAPAGTLPGDFVWGVPGAGVLLDGILDLPPAERAQRMEEWKAAARPHGSPLAVTAETTTAADAICA